MRDSRSTVFLSLSLIGALAACGDNNNNANPDAAKHVDGTPAIDAPKADAAIDSAPTIDSPMTTTIDLATGESGNDIHWVAASSTLYLDTYSKSGTTFTGKLRKYTDAGGLADVASTTNSNTQFQLAGLTPLMGGAFLVAQFFPNTADSMYYVASGTATEMTQVTGLVSNATIRRIGVASAMGKTYDLNFTGGTTNTSTVNKVTLDVTVPAVPVATETSIASQHDTTTFTKLVGIVVSGTNVFVSEQNKTTANTSAIYKIDTANANAVTTVSAALPCADFITTLPNGDFLTGTGDGCAGATAGIIRVTPAGVITTLPITGLDAVLGIAYDATGKRLFVLNHPATGTDSLKIIPYDAGT